MPPACGVFIVVSKGGAGPPCAAGAGLGVVERTKLDHERRIVLGEAGEHGPGVVLDGLRGEVGAQLAEKLADDRLRRPPAP